MSDISILIIGAGNIANDHLKSLSSIKKINIYSILSRTQIKADQLAISYKIKNVIKSYSDLPNHINKIDLIMVLVNPDQILSVFNKIKIYKKFIFFEKPIGINFIESKKILNDVQKLNLKTFVGFNRRFYSNLNHGLKKLLYKDKKIVSIVIEGNERIWLVKKIDKHNSYINFWPYVNSIHTVDLIRHIGGEVKYQSFHKQRSNFSYYSLMKTKNNILVNYISNYDFFDGWSVKIYNNNGEYIHLKPLENCSFISKKSVNKIDFHQVDKKFKAGFNPMHLKMIDVFKNTSKDSHKYNIQDAFKSVKLVKKIFY